MKPTTIIRLSILIAAAASLALSVLIFFTSDSENAELNGIYIGTWVPSILALGVFLVVTQEKKG